jgi:hypothetical protein
MSFLTYDVCECDLCGRQYRVDNKQVNGMYMIKDVRGNVTYLQKPPGMTRDHICNKCVQFISSLN